MTRNPIKGRYRDLMVRKIGVSCRDKTGTQDIETKRASGVTGIASAVCPLQVARVRVKAARRDEHGDGRKGRDDQNAEGATVPEARATAAPTAARLRGGYPSW